MTNLISAVALRPPFPWVQASQISHGTEASLIKVEKTIRQINAEVVGNRSIKDEAGRISSSDWLIAEALNYAERSMQPIRAAFVSQLAKSWSRPAVNNIGRLTETHRSLYRQRHIYSCNLAGWRDVRYYPWYAIEEEIGRLCVINREYHSLPKLLRIIGTYVNFLHVHPFVDENGRAARYLLDALLRQQKLWDGPELPAPYLIRADRCRHNLVLQRFAETSNWVPLLEYFSRLLCAAAELAAKLICLDGSSRLGAGQDRLLKPEIDKIDP